MPVIGTYRTWYPALELLQDRGADLYRCDFESKDDVERLIRDILTRYQRLRAVIHNASDWLSDDDGIAVDAVHRQNDAGPRERPVSTEPCTVRRCCRHVARHTPTSFILGTM